MLLGSEYDPQKDPQNSVGIICIDENGHTFLHILDGDTSPEAILEAIKKMQEMGFGVTKVKQGDIVTPINTFLNLWSHLNKKPDFPELEIPKRKPDFPEPDYPDLDF